MDRLACMQDMLASVDDILAATRARDGEAIEAQQTRYLLLAERLKEFPVLAADSPDATAVRKLAEKILCRQQELEGLIHPWMDDMRVLFRESSNKKALSAAYKQGT